MNTIAYQNEYLRRICTAADDDSCANVARGAYSHNTLPDFLWCPPDVLLCPDNTTAAAAMAAAASSSSSAITLTSYYNIHRYEFIYNEGEKKNHIGIEREKKKNNNKRNYVRMTQ